MLLKLGMKLTSIKENLFIVTYEGYATRGDFSTLYNDLISDMYNNDVIFRNDIYNYGKLSQIDIIKLLISYDYPVNRNTHIIDPWSDLYYDIDIFAYFIKNGMDINKIWEVDMGYENYNRDLLTGAIILSTPNKMYLNIIEFLLQNGANNEITNYDARNLVFDPIYKPIETLLLKYGVCL